MIKYLQSFNDHSSICEHDNDPIFENVGNGLLLVFFDSEWSWFSSNGDISTSTAKAMDIDESVGCFLTYCHHSNKC